MPEGTKFDLEIGIGSTMKLRAIIGGLIFIPAADKIVIAPVKENPESIKLADKSALELYDFLPHTPIDGIGYNFTYQLEKNEFFSGAVNFSSEQNEKKYQKFGGTAASTSTMLHSVKVADDPDVILNLTYQISEGEHSLQLNYHYSIKPKPEKAKDALGKFYKSYEHSKQVSSVLITKEVK
jgi:hypothetical protein